MNFELVGTTKRYGKKKRNVYAKDGKEYVRMFGNMFETQESYYKKNKRY